MSAGRELLDDLGRAVHTARNLRYRKPDEFDDVSTDDLETAAGHLRAVAYSANQGAILLARIVTARRTEQPT